MFVAASVGDRLHRRAHRASGAIPLTAETRRMVTEPSHLASKFMYVITFTAESALPISEFQSERARAQALADGDGECHVYFVHLDAGGFIGPHPAGFDQL